MHSNAQAAQRFIGADPPDLAEVWASLADIVGDGRRAGEVIRRLRKLLEKGEHERSPIGLNELFREIEPLLRNQALGANIAFEFDMSPELPPVMGDRIQLQQVVLNLVLNGFDAIGDLQNGPRELSVRTESGESGYVTLAVRDTGVGIDEQTKKLMFDAFFSTKRDGMGMGLAISQRVIRAHGGRLWAIENPDRGLTVHFELPAMGRGR